MKWIVLFSMFVMVVFSFSCENKNESASQSENSMVKLKNMLENEIEASGAEVGIALKDLESGDSLLINAYEMMHAASTMKVPVMIEVYHQAEQGKFNLDDSLLVKNEFHSIVDGSPYSMDISDDSDGDIYNVIGKKMTIRELIFHTITSSSNLATNILVELVGAKNVMSTLNELGMHHMQVLRGVEDIKAYEQGLNNRTDAYDMMLTMEAIATGRVGSDKSCEEMIDILSQQKFREKIPAGIPDGVKIANKTGSITKIDHDAAIVFPDNHKPYILVILTRSIADHKAAQQLIARLSNIVYKELLGS